MKSIRVSETGIDNTGKTIVTSDLQKLIDEYDEVYVDKGVFQTAPLFLRSNFTLHIEENATILGTTDESIIPVIKTRVAGIMMEWYPAVINCIDSSNVTITGKGRIDGQGEYWWEKYWGKDMKSGMRKHYDAANVRWACDYDCKRVRNVCVYNCDNVLLSDFNSHRSGFWNVHICFSSNVTVDNIKISGCGTLSPSTDGIDVDSSENILIKNCTFDCNDDSISIKSGRDYDGYVINRPTKNVTVRDCRFYAGFGATIGSEVSGGIEDIHFNNLIFDGTDCGIRIKSSEARKGYIKNVYIKDVDMTNVKYPIHFLLDWNPGYSRCILPEGFNYKEFIRKTFPDEKHSTTDAVPMHWEKLLKPLEGSNTEVRNIFIENLTSKNTDDYEGISRALNIIGYKNQPVKDVYLKNVSIKAYEYGVVENVENMMLENVNIISEIKYDKNSDDFDNR